MDQQVKHAAVATVSPIVRCMVLRDDSVLLLRESIRLQDDDGRYFDSSHWELPLGRLLRDESGESAAYRVVYRKTRGLQATKIELVPRPQISRSDRLIFHPHHFYYLATELSGISALDGTKAEAEGKLAWVPLEMISAYAIRSETVAMLELLKQRL